MREAPPKDEMDRRRFLRLAGRVAWSTPVIWSVMQSRAAASHGTCLHRFDRCSAGGVPCCPPNECDLETNFCLEPEGSAMTRRQYVT
jgi:hypothetical protein